MNWAAISKTQEEIKAGALYIVSTPIGNLADISLRALFVLDQVQLIAAEDTRTSSHLLQHYDIVKKLFPYHDHNKEKVTPVIVDKLSAGESVAVISDAGTPGISDPAFYLVREAIKLNIPVIAIPGAAAFLTALVVSGLPTDRFVFEGFLPVKKGRLTRLEQIKDDPRTLIFYESAKRLPRTVRDLFNVLGDRQIVIARELTKKFEKIVHGSLSTILDNNELILKGEFVILVEGWTRKLKRNL